MISYGLIDKKTAMVGGAFSLCNPLLAMNFLPFPKIILFEELFSVMTGGEMVWTQLA